MARERPVLGAVLAGGKARRMGGYPKGLLVRADGLSLLEGAVNALLATCDRVVVVADPAGPYAPLAAERGWQLIPDRWPGLGAPGGLVTALGVASASGQADDAWVMVMPCDLRGADSAMVSELWPHRAGRLTCWTLEAQLQTLVALWRVDLAGELASRLDGLIAQAEGEVPKAPGLRSWAAEFGGRGVEVGIALAGALGDLNGRNTRS